MKQKTSFSTQSAMNSDFFLHVSRFLLFFGGFWVLFTGGFMILSEGKMYMANPVNGIAAFASLLYVAKVFFFFYRDVKQKADNPKYVLVSNWTNFLIDVGVLLFLTILQFQSAEAVTGTITTSQFNSLSNVFLSLVFHFFRFVYHILSTE